MSGSSPWGWRWRSSTSFIISTVGLAMFADLFLYGIIVPIFPYLLVDRVHIPRDQLQSHVSILLAVHAFATVIFSPAASVLADRSKSTRAPYLIGLFASLAATLMLCLGRSVAVIAVARVLQGMSVAVVWTIGLTLLVDTVGPRQLGTTIGSLFGVNSIGQFSAPVVGGVVYSKGGYLGILGVAFVMLAADFTMRILVIEKKTARKYHLSTVAEDEARQESENTSHPSGTLDPPSENDPLIRTQPDAQYKLPERKHSKAVRIFPILLIMNNPRLLVALLLGLVQATLLSTYNATVPLIAQDYYGFKSSLTTSLLFLALVLPYVTLGPIAGWVVDKRGARPVAVCGLVCLTIVLALLRLVRPGGKKQVAIYCVLLALNGGFTSFIAAPSLVEASSVVDRYDQANPSLFGSEGPWSQLYGLTSMLFSTGLTIGPLISGGLKILIGYGNMNLVMAALTLVTAILSFIFIDRESESRARDDGTTIE